jgi:UDP-N-acetylglucosamine:LPS N-acetylglucosamine transferase
MARLGRYRVVVLTGQNTSLRRRLRSRYPTTQVLGWVDDMASLLSASDVVIENAGGLTAMEAMACRVPVVSYLPIPGHGRDNVEMMAEAGVSSYARTEEQLGELLEALVEDSPLRRRQVLAACSMWRQDPAWEVLRLVRGAVRLRPAQ